MEPWGTWSTVREGGSEWYWNERQELSISVRLVRPDGSTPSGSRLLNSSPKASRASPGGSAPAASGWLKSLPKVRWVWPVGSTPTGSGWLKNPSKVRLVSPGGRFNYLAKVGAEVEAGEPGRYR